MVLRSSGPSHRDLRARSQVLMTLTRISSVILTETLEHNCVQIEKTEARHQNPLPLRCKGVKSKEKNELLLLSLTNHPETERELSEAGSVPKHTCILFYHCIIMTAF